MQYALSFLTPYLDSKERAKLLKEILDKIKKLDGKIEDKFIEKKIFAYPVKKNLEGFLGQIIFSIEKVKLKNFEEFLKSEKNIIRGIIERKKKVPEKLEAKRKKPPFKKTLKKEKVKIEELDKKLEEILK